MQRAETLWAQNADSDRDDLVDAIDYHGSLRSQVGIKHTRVVYNASGTYPKAALVVDPDVVVSHKLYWMSVDDMKEAWFLLGLFNSKGLMDAIDHLIIPSGFGNRDISKDPWRLPIARFDSGSNIQVRIAELARAAAVIAGRVDIDHLGSHAAQRLIRQQVWKSEVGRSLDAHVRRLLGVPHAA